MLSLSANDSTPPPNPHPSKKDNKQKSVDDAAVHAVYSLFQLNIVLQLLFHTCCSW